MALNSTHWVMVGARTSLPPHRDRQCPVSKVPPDKVDQEIQSNDTIPFCERRTQVLGFTMDRQGSKRESRQSYIMSRAHLLVQLIRVTGRSHTTLCDADLRAMYVGCNLKH